MKALPYLKAVVGSNEAAYDANVALGTISLAQHDTATALDAFQRAVFINPFPADVHRTLAAVAGARGDHASAVREREALVALDPVDKAEALYELALAHRAAGDTAQAKHVVLMALEEAPNFVKAQDLLLAIVDGKEP